MTAVLDISVFRQTFPAFASVTLYPDASITLRWGLAVGMFGDQDNWALSGASLQSALNLLTAHLLQLATATVAGGTGPSVTGPVVSATVDKVSVTVAAPVAKSAWQYWLASTPYGQELAALLSLVSAGGLYVGGLPERRGFRKIGGVF